MTSSLRCETKVDDQKRAKFCLKLQNTIKQVSNKNNVKIVTDIDRCPGVRLNLVY